MHREPYAATIASLARLDCDECSPAFEDIREDSLGTDGPEDFDRPDPVDPLHKVVAYGLRHTAGGRFSVVEVVTHRNVDVRQGRRMELGRFTTHRGLPGSVTNEATAEAKARELAERAGVEFVGFRADSL